METSGVASVFLDRIAPCSSCSPHEHRPLDSSAQEPTHSETFRPLSWHESKHGTVELGASKDTNNRSMPCTEEQQNVRGNVL